MKIPNSVIELILKNRITSYNFLKNLIKKRKNKERAKQLVEYFYLL